MRTIGVIGDSRGIGAALRNQLLENDFRVVGVSRTGGDSFGNYISVQQDAVEEPVDFSEHVDQLDGLVYCPGSITLKPFLSLKPEQVMNDLRINYLAAFENVQKNLRFLKKGDNPSIVLFSTVAVDQGMPFHSSISGAKAAVQGLTRALAAELAPSVRVNAIAPSLVDTDLASQLLNNEKKAEAAKERHPLKRVGTRDDIASMARYLLSTDSGWVTGQVMGVDGGLSRLKV